MNTARAASSASRWPPAAATSSRAAVAGPAVWLRRSARSTSGGTASVPPPLTRPGARCRATTGGRRLASADIHRTVRHPSAPCCVTSSRVGDLASSGGWHARRWCLACSGSAPSSEGPFRGAVGEPAAVRVAIANLWVRSHVLRAGVRRRRTGAVLAPPGAARFRGRPWAGRATSRLSTSPIVRSRGVVTRSGRSCWTSERFRRPSRCFTT